MNVPSVKLIGLLKIPKVAFRIKTRVVLGKTNINKNKSCCPNKLGTSKKFLLITFESFFVRPGTQCLCSTIRLSVQNQNPKHFPNEAVVNSTRLLNGNQTLR